MNTYKFTYEQDFYYKQLITSRIVKSYRILAKDVRKALMFFNNNSHENTKLIAVDKIQ